MTHSSHSTLTNSLHRCSSELVGKIFSGPALYLLLREDGAIKGTPEYDQYRRLRKNLIQARYIRLSVNPRLP